MWEVLHNEPLACIFWVSLIVFLATWGWAGDRYSTRAQERERRAWEGAIQWANKVLDPDWKWPWKDDEQSSREQAAKVNARRILRGETREHHF